MKVYVVTAGCYSDYHICGVCTTLEKATELMNYMNRDEYNSAEIEEYDTDVWESVLSIGGMYSVSERPLLGRIDVTELDGSIEDAYENRNHIRDNGIRGLSTWVVAKDEDHAKKIASDLFAKYRAEKEGL